MVKNKVEWSAEARLDLYDILNFYIIRNGNAIYSRKLNSKIHKSVKLITKNPFIGTKTNMDSVFTLIAGDYLIIYELIESKILIVMIWDSRRNPEDNTKILQEK